MPPKSFSPPTDTQDIIFRENNTEINGRNRPNDCRFDHREQDDLPNYSNSDFSYRVAMTTLLEPARGGMVGAAGRSNAPGNDCSQWRIDGDRPWTSSPSAATPGSGAQNDLFPLLPPLLQPTKIRTPCRGGADLPKHTFLMPDFDFKNILS